MTGLHETAAADGPRPADSQGKLLGVVTYQTMQRLGENALLMDADNHVCTGKAARVGNIWLREWPADKARPRKIYAYWTDGDRTVNLDPSRCLYCLQWQHRAHPPDFHLQLIKDHAELWAEYVIMTLLAELQKHDPHLLDGV
jgi:hypothetical protein